MDNETVLLSDQFFSASQLPLRVMRVPSHGVSPTPHKHDFTELVVILDGLGKHEVGREVYTIQTGDVFVILGDMSHAYRETKDLYLINILMDIPRLGFPALDLRGVPGYHALFEVEPIMRNLGNFQNRLRLSMDQLATATKFIAEIEEELANDQRGCHFMATAHLMRLIGYLSRCYSQLQLDEIRPVTQISKLLGYLERHCADPISIAEMTKIARMSQTSLMRSFRQIVGRSPMNHLIQLRVSRAQELLRRTDMPVTDIATAVGFCDGNYLARQFRRVNGISPRQYRQKWRDQRSK